MSLQDDDEHFLSGIFIKNVLENSPAGRTGQLKTGDRILEVLTINDLGLTSKLPLYNLCARSTERTSGMHPIMMR